MDNNLLTLKFHLQEKQFPYFTDDELQELLTMYKDIYEAAYEGCLIKAHDDGIKLGPISANSNEQYWLRRAKHFQLKMDKYRINATGSMRRVDEI